MSGLHTQTQEMPKQVIARFDDLFPSTASPLPGTTIIWCCTSLNITAINRLRFRAKP